MNRLMSRTAKNRELMRIALVSALVIGFACSTYGGDKSPNGIPILLLEKEKYVKGEAIGSVLI